MALFSMRVQVIKRSAGRSVIAAAAYRSGEKIHDERQDLTHDYRNRKDVERTELIFPEGSPDWVQGISRERFWNAVDAAEKRKDAQLSREVRLMLPRELPTADRITLVRDYVIRNFVSRGMVADVCWHNKVASDGLEQPHAHVMLTMRPLSDSGFGQKSRHDMVPDPDGRTRPDGTPLLVPSNEASWNLSSYYESTREDWENTANAALAQIGSTERIDRRSLIERGLARLPEPALRLAFHLKELRGVMKDRWGQFQAAKLFQAVERRANAAFRSDTDPAADLKARAQQRATATAGREESPHHRFKRFQDWVDRQLSRLSIAPTEQQPAFAHAPPPAEHAKTKRPSPDIDMER